MATTTKKLNIKKMTNQQLQPIILTIVLIAMLIVFTSMNSNFITWTNLHTILLSAVTVGIMTIGQSCCKLANYFDMSVGMVGAMGGLAAGKVLVAGGSVGAAVAAGLAVGLICGLMAGFLVSFMGMNAWVTTFALSSAYRGVIYIFTDGFPIPLFDQVYAPFTKWGSMMVGGFMQFPIVVMLVLYVLVQLFLSYRKLGRSIYLVGGNQYCSHICGINVRAVQMFIFIICDVLAAFAGILFASRMSSAAAFLSDTTTLEAIAATVVAGVVAGRGNMFVSFIGVLIIFTLKNGLVMVGLPDFYQYLAIGVVIYLAVMVQAEHKKN
jgi:ribose/xylose/arabinose/galactoside ABC-type transport system permease subunit